METIRTGIVIVAVVLALGVATVGVSYGIITWRCACDARTQELKIKLSEISQKEAWDEHTMWK